MFRPTNINNLSSAINKFTIWLTGTMGHDSEAIGFDN